MIGTLLNVTGMLVGGAVGLTRSKVLPLAAESYLKIILAALTVFYGLRLTWLSLNGSAYQLLKQGLILVGALIVGRLTGRLLRLQTISNCFGKGAQERMMQGKSIGENRVTAAFKASTVLFCLAPLGMVGAVADGLSAYFYPLAIKAAIDGFATMGLVLMLGWGVMLAVVPVLAVQGTITLVSANLLSPFLAAHGLLDSVNSVAGVLIFCVSLIMLGLKRIELADYLPSLAVAPLLTWLCH
jgi:uncharacterized protein